MRPVLAATVMVAAFLAAPAAPAGAQCAMCKTALTGSPEGREISRTFNVAILVMLAGPYLVVGGLVGILYRKPIATAWRSRVRRAPRPRA